MLDSEEFERLEKLQEQLPRFLHNTFFEYLKLKRKDVLESIASCEPSQLRRYQGMLDVIDDFLTMNQ